MELIVDWEAKLSGLAASISSSESPISNSRPDLVFPYPSVLGLDADVVSEIGRVPFDLVLGVPGKGTNNFVPGILNLALLGVKTPDRLVSGLSKLSRSA